MDSRQSWTALACTLGVLGLAIPPLGSVRARAHPETVALKTMAAIHAGEADRLAMSGQYAGALDELQRLPSGLAQTGEYGGYRFVLAQSGTGYTIRANPIQCGAGGSRSFFSDESLRIHQRACPEAASRKDSLLD